MKKIFLMLTICLLSGFYTQAQNNAYADAKERLRKNENAVYELEKLLTTDYTQITNTSMIVPTSTFKMGESIVVTSYGDAGINQQAKQMEAEFNKMFEGSTWKFSPESQSANSTVAVTTKAGQTETSNYNCSGSAMIQIGGLIQGLTLNITVSQSKADAKSFIFTFSPSNGMLVVMEVKK
jgi:hypothetical protein